MSKQGSTICPHNEEPFRCAVCNTPTDDLISRLRKRAEIRRQIPGRKSVESGEPDRIANLLDEAADALTKLSPSAESDKKVTGLDTKNGVRFEAETEAMYIIQLEKLKDLLSTKEAALEEALGALRMSAARNGQLEEENKRLREERLNAGIRAAANAMARAGRKDGYTWLVARFPEAFKVAVRDEPASGEQRGKG